MSELNAQVIVVGAGPVLLPPASNTSRHQELPSYDVLFLWSQHHDDDLALSPPPFILLLLLVLVVV